MQQRSRCGFDDIFDRASNEQEDHQEYEACEHTDADACNHNTGTFDGWVWDLWMMADQSMRERPFRWRDANLQSCGQRRPGIRSVGEFDGEGGLNEHNLSVQGLLGEASTFLSVLKTQRPEGKGVHPRAMRSHRALNQVSPESPFNVIIVLTVCLINEFSKDKTSVISGGSCQHSKRDLLSRRIMW